MARRIQSRTIRLQSSAGAFAGAIRQRPVHPVELLESRRLLSAASIHITPSVTAHAAATTSSSISGYTPAQIRTAYGFNNISFSGSTGSVVGDGSGQTIAIVDAYNAPNIKSDLAVFDKQFGLSAPASFSIVGQTGSSRLPATDASWAQETSLDVEWAHAIAPKASILLVESKDETLGNLIKAVNYARTVKGVSVVSMSWGSSEFSGEAGYDKNFTTPAGHTGVTFVAAAGDNGADGGAQWPASSPNVLSVGGTSLSLNSNNTISSESTWQDTSGGTSSFESVPSYQSALNVGARTTSDVSYNADPNTGFATYDSLAYQGESGWMETGGTSAGTPQWAALIAIADQGRSVQGRTSLDGASGTLPALYNIYNNPTTYAADFNDITTGSNGFSFGGGNYGGNYGGNDWGGWGGPFGGFPFGGFPFGFPFTATAAVRTASSAATSTNTPSITSAAPGFDLPTGLGTPKAAGVIASLVSSGVSKSVKLKSSAKVAHSIKLHPAVAVPPPDAQPSAFVSQSAPLRPAAPSMDAERFAELSGNAIVARPVVSAVTDTPSLSNAAPVSQAMSGFLTATTSDRSIAQTAEHAIASAASTVAADAKVLVNAWIAPAAITATESIAPQFFSITHIDAAATFQDAVCTFADECASLPAALPAAIEHSSTRPWIFTGLVVAAEAVVLIRQKHKRRLASAIAR